MHSEPTGAIQNILVNTYVVEKRWAGLELT